MNVFKSEELWVAIAAVIFNVAGFYVTNYIPNPMDVQLAKMILGGLDTVAVVLIGGFTVKNVAAMKYFGVSSYRYIPPKQLPPVKK